MILETSKMSLIFQYLDLVSLIVLNAIGTILEMIFIAIQLLNPDWPLRFQNNK